MGRAAIKIEIKETGQVDKLLGKMPLELRQNALAKAIRRAGNVVAKEARRLAPKPGYEGDKPGLMPLNQTIHVVVRKYPNAVAAFVGPQYPSGAHGHLVEYGHEKVLWGKRTGDMVEPKPFLRPAADTTEADQQREIITTLKKEIGKLAR